MSNQKKADQMLDDAIQKALQPRSSSTPPPSPAPEPCPYILNGSFDEHEGARCELIEGHDGKHRAISVSKGEPMSDPACPVPAPEDTPEDGCICFLARKVDCPVHGNRGPSLMTRVAELERGFDALMGALNAETELRIDYTKVWRRLSSDSGTEDTK